MINKTTVISLNFGAHCSASKQIHQKRPEKSAKYAHFLKSAYNIPSSSNKPCQSTKLYLSSRINCQPTGQTTHNAHPVFSHASLSNEATRSISKEDAYIKRITKIYQSQCQSGTVVVCGVEIPCAPPATPTSEQMRSHQYIPSLNDVMAQRAVKERLEKMEKVKQKQEENRKEKESKQEKIYEKDRLCEIKQQQRLEIYALNSMMTELEKKNFNDFCESREI